MQERGGGFGGLWGGGGWGGGGVFCLGVLFVGLFLVGVVVCFWVCVGSLREKGEYRQEHYVYRGVNR